MIDRSESLYIFKKMTPTFYLIISKKTKNVFNCTLKL